MRSLEDLCDDFVDIIYSDGMGSVDRGFLRKMARKIIDHPDEKPVFVTREFPYETAKIGFTIGEMDGGLKVNWKSEDCTIDGSCRFKV